VFETKLIYSMARECLIITAWEKSKIVYTLYFTKDLTKKHKQKNDSKCAVFNAH